MQGGAWTGPWKGGRVRPGSDQGHVWVGPGSDAEKHPCLSPLSSCSSCARLLSSSSFCNCVPAPLASCSRRPDGTSPAPGRQGLFLGSNPHSQGRVRGPPQSHQGSVAFTKRLPLSHRCGPADIRGVLGAGTHVQGFLRHGCPFTALLRVASYGCYQRTNCAQSVTMCDTPAGSEPTAAGSKERGLSVAAPHPRPCCSELQLEGVAQAKG